MVLLILLNPKSFLDAWNCYKKAKRINIYKIYNIYNFNFIKEISPKTSSGYFNTYSCNFLKLLNFLISRLLDH